MNSKAIENICTEEPPVLRLALLGGFHVWVGTYLIPEAAWKRRKVQALVKLLALDSRHRLHREQLMNLLWPTSEIDAARNNLRQTLYLARRIIANQSNPACQYLADLNAWLILSPHGEVWVDVEAFEIAARSARRSGDPADYQLALALYTGELLPEDRYDDWVVPRREALRILYESLLFELGRLLAFQGDLAQAVDIFRQLTIADPMQEEAHQALMRLYAARGQRHLALQQYRQLCKILQSELAVEPDPASQKLYEAISSGHSGMQFAAQALFPAELPPQSNQSWH